MPLPPGLGLNPNTGVISGVPTTPGTYNFTLRVRDSAGNVRDQPATIVIAPYTPPSLSGTLAAFANRTVPYSSGLAVSDGVAPFTWSISSGTLPSGLAINAATGVISGTPTDTSYTDRTITVRVVDANGSAAQSTQTIRYADVMSLGGSLNSGVQAASYSDGFDRTGGHAPFTWAITSGVLPAGLSLNTTTGVISGTPTGTSSTSLTIRVTDAAGATASRTGTLVINSAYTAIDLSGSITSNTQDVETLSSFSITPNYSAVAVTGGSPPITYSWARISGSTAISAGSPSSLATSFVGSVSPGSSVSATFRVTATDGISSDTLDVTITVNNVYVAMGLSIGSLPLGTRTVAYSGSLSRTGGKSPYTFSVIAGTLPTGVTLNGSTGALSGTPTDTSYTNRAMTFRVTDALGATADASGTITYRNFPVIGYTPPAAMRTRPYSFTVLAPGDGHTGTFSIASGTLPTGITLSGSGSAVFSGTPTDTSYGPRPITLRFTDAAGNIANAAGTLQYANNLTLAGSFPASVTGASYSSSAVTASGGHGSNVWSVASGSLPTGLSLNAGTGALSGTPSAAGTFNFTVRVTDGQGFTADSAQSVVISAALSASASPTSASGNFTNSPASLTPSTRVVISETTTVAASGGTPPYTYSWTRIGGSSAVTAGSPSSAATNFSATVGIDSAQNATFRCTVTDAALASATVDVAVSLTYDSGF